MTREEYVEENEWRRIKGDKKRKIKEKYLISSG